MASRGGVDVMSMPQDLQAYPMANGGKRKLEDGDQELDAGAKKAKPDVEASEVAEAEVDQVDEEQGEEAAIRQELCTAEPAGVSGEPVAKRHPGVTEATPSCSEVEVKEEEDEEEEGGKNEDVRQSGDDSRRESETPPPAEEPRVKRGASKKAAVNRAFNNKNFLKNILPNITRLSRTEVLYDLKVMDGTTRMRTDRSERDRS